MTVFYLAILTLISVTTFLGYLLTSKIKLARTKKKIINTPSLLTALGPNEKVLSYRTPHIVYKDILIGHITVQKNHTESGFPKVTEREIEVRYQV